MHKKMTTYNYHTQLAICSDCFVVKCANMKLCVNGRVNIYVLFINFYG